MHPRAAGEGGGASKEELKAARTMIRALRGQKGRLEAKVVRALAAVKTAKECAQAKVSSLA